MDKSTATNNSAATTSGALETPTVNISMAAGWMPAALNTPSLKLPTPVLDGMNGPGWGAGGLLSSGGPGLGSGMSPRFMLDNLRMSPGVSGSIAPNADAPKASNASLAELFIVDGYQTLAAAAQNKPSATGTAPLPPKPPQPQPSQSSNTAAAAAALMASTSLPATAALMVSQPLQTTAAIMVSQSLPQPLPATTGVDAAAARAQAAMMSQPMTVPQIKRDVAAPQPQQVAYPQARTLPHTTQVQPPQPAQRYAPATVAAYNDMYAQPGAQRLGLAAAPPPAAPRRRNAASNAIEEAKQNAQERADKFAQKRKRSRKQQEEEGKLDAPLSEEDKNASPSELKKKRYNRRLELNRQSAAVSRVRRRAYVEELEGKLMHVEREKLNLEDQVGVMQSENHKLREQMRHLHEQLANSTRAAAAAAQGNYPSLPPRDKQ